MPKKVRNQSQLRLKAPERAALPASAGFEASGGSDREADSGLAAPGGQQVWPGDEWEDFADLMVILDLS